MWPQKSQLSLVIGWWMDKDCLMSDTDKSPSFCHRLRVHLETHHPHSARQFRLCFSFHFPLVQSLKVSQRLELRPSAFTHVHGFLHPQECVEDLSKPQWRSSPSVFLFKHFSLLFAPVVIHHFRQLWLKHLPATWFRQRSLAGYSPRGRNS